MNLHIKQIIAVIFLAISLANSAWCAADGSGDVVPGGFKRRFFKIDYEATEREMSDMVGKSIRGTPQDLERVLRWFKSLLEARVAEDCKTIEERDYTRFDWGILLKPALRAASRALVKDKLRLSLTGSSYEGEPEYVREAAVALFETLLATTAFSEIKSVLSAIDDVRTDNLVWCNGRERDRLDKAYKDALVQRRLWKLDGYSNFITKEDSYAEEAMDYALSVVTNHSFSSRLRWKGYEDDSGSLKLVVDVSCREKAYSLIETLLKKGICRDKVKWASMSGKTYGRHGYGYDKARLKALLADCPAAAVWAGDHA